MKMDWLAVYRKAIDPAEAVLRRERLARLRKDASRNLASALCGLPLEEREEALVRRMGDLLPEDLAAVQASIRRDAVKAGRIEARRRSLRRWAKLRVAKFRTAVGTLFEEPTKKGRGRLRLTVAGAFGEFARLTSGFIVGTLTFAILKWTGVEMAWSAVPLGLVGAAFAYAGWHGHRGYGLRHAVLPLMIADVVVGEGSGIPGLFVGSVEVGVAGLLMLRFWRMARKGGME